MILVHSIVVIILGLCLLFDICMEISLIGSDSAMYYLLIDFYIKVLEYIAHAFVVTHLRSFFFIYVCIQVHTYLLYLCPIDDLEVRLRQHSIINYVLVDVKNSGARQFTSLTIQDDVADALPIKINVNTQMCKHVN